MLLPGEHRTVDGQQQAAVPDRTPPPGPRPFARVRPAFSFTVCIRDDDTRRFEFQVASDASAIMGRVAAAVARGRHLRCYVLAAGERSREREEGYLVSKGYSQAAVKP